MSAVDIEIMGSRNCKKYPDASTQEFEGSWKEYILIAKKLIASLAPRYRSGLSTQMLRSDDTISNMATSVMMADWSWNGNGSRFGYRKQCAEWAIKNYMHRQKIYLKNKPLSFNHIYCDGMELVDLVKSTNVYSENPQVIAMSKEQTSVIKRLLNSGILSNKQTQYITMHYLEGKQQTEIAKIIGVSRQAVRESIKRGLNKLKELTKCL